MPRVHVVRLLWSRDGQRLAAAMANGEIYIWDASSGYRFADSDDYIAEQVRNRVICARESFAAGDRDEALTQLRRY